MQLQWIWDFLILVLKVISWVTLSDSYNFSVVHFAHVQKMPASVGEL